MTSTPEAVPQVKRTPAAGHLYVSLELADKCWRLTASDGTRVVSRYTVPAGDQAAVLECVRKARARFRLSSEAPVHSCYEAGRDGWWLHRWLRQQGIDNLVVDAASIEVNRHARRAKTDRIDGDKLLGLLLRHHGGEARVWSVLREPSVEQEDARRTHREIGRLTHERNAHTNRISGLLVLHNLRARGIGTRTWSGWWSAHREQVPPKLAAEIERETVRLQLVRQQLAALETERRREVATHAHPHVAQLSRLRAIGLRGAWLLDKELFGWRRFANRRQLAGLPRTDTHTLQQWQQRHRARHQQGRQQTRPCPDGRAGLALARLAARQRPGPVVQAALRSRQQTHATRRHRGLGTPPGHRAMALPRVWPSSRRRSAQTTGRGLTFHHTGSHFPINVDAPDGVPGHGHRDRSVRDRARR